MIELTQSHEHIINWQAQGKPDDWIAKKLGYSPSEFLDACAFINRFREQETARMGAQKKLEPLAFPVGNVEQINDAAAYRVLVDSKKPLMSRDVGEQIGLSAFDASKILERLTRRKLVMKAGSRLWRAK